MITASLIHFNGSAMNAPMERWESCFQSSPISVCLRKLKADCNTSKDMLSACLSALWLVKLKERKNCGILTMRSLLKGFLFLFHSPRGRQSYCPAMSTYCLVKWMSLKSLGTGLPLWCLSSQWLPPSCHLIHLAEQPLSPVLLSVTKVLLFPD